LIEFDDIGDYDLFRLEVHSEGVSILIASYEDFYIYDEVTHEFNNRFNIDEHDLKMYFDRLLDDKCLDDVTSEFMEFLETAD
ncbi:hypothetical protein, partial [Leifsonia shinshuensis]|uniref:hypothetical protein n=1 Tax=Leifsonia shinshuensis TaxID=150026 RepID=UPI0035E8655F